MPFDEGQIRQERFQVESLYHAAYTFWSLRGVIAERWAHGPVFGAAGEGPAQVTLTAADGEENNPRIAGIYGLRGSAINAEGPVQVSQGQEMYEEWFGDVFEVLKPKRVVRNVVRLVALYPVDDAVQVSRALRSRYYRGQELGQTLPPSLEGERERFHSAINYFIPLPENSGAVSVVVGTIGPAHESGFFNFPDEQRDSRWWLGVTYEHRHSSADGITDPGTDLAKIVPRAQADCRHVFTRVLQEVIK